MVVQRRGQATLCRHEQARQCPGSLVSRVECRGRAGRLAGPSRSEPRRSRGRKARGGRGRGVRRGLALRPRRRLLVGRGGGRSGVHALLRRQGQPGCGFRRAQRARAVALRHRADAAGQGRLVRRPDRDARGRRRPRVRPRPARAALRTRRRDGEGAVEGRPRRARERSRAALRLRRLAGARGRHARGRARRRSRAARSPASIPRRARAAGARATTSSPTRYRWS